MSNISSAGSASTASFKAALVFNAIVFGVELGVFTLIRPYFKSVYEPRTYVPPPAKRVKPLSNNMFLWPWAIYKADYRAIIKANGMDAYFFVRFLRMMVVVFLPIWLISWAVLLPVNRVGTDVSNVDSLNTFTFGNVPPDQKGRYAAHLILAWVFTAWILYNIRVEMNHFITMRQIHLVEPSHSKSLQANTILVTGVPVKYLTHEALYHLFKDLPGGVKKIWINRNLKELPEVYDRRMTACAKLESAETALLRTAAKLRAELIKKGKGAEQQELVVSSSDDVASADVVPTDQRPTHRLGFLGLWGKKVDSIEWAREEIRVCNELLDEGRRTIKQEDSVNDIEHGHLTKGKEAILKKMRIAGGSEQQSKYPPLNSAFITFYRQISTHLAAQALLHHKPYCMSGKYFELKPDDVIWSNLGMNPYEQKVRMALSYAATGALIIFWTFPVALIGAISSISSVCSEVRWLNWICSLPDAVKGIISGVLPPVLLAVLLMLLPIVLRLFAKFEGIPQKTGVELSLMSRFFIFQVIHSFLIVTLSSGVVSSLNGFLHNPTSIPSLLAKYLPQASTFFLTYIILQGLSGTAGGFLQIVTLVIYYVKLFIFGSTPRSVYDVKYGTSNVAWGTLFPMTTLLSVIAIGYSVISPIINGLAFLTFLLFYFLYKYLFIWVYQENTDTGGLFFPKAMQHLFVGLYIGQVCLAALFFLSRDSNNKAAAVPEGGLMIALIAITAFYQLIINNSFDPLEKALPLSLADKMYMPVIAAPASAGPSIITTDGDIPDKQSDDAHVVANTGGVDSQENETNAEEDTYGFAHPAVSRPQRTVWLPRDPLGLAEKEEQASKDAGIDVSVGPDAVMNEEGKVDITGPPPDVRALNDSWLEQDT
ncbi:hypothetical protein M378DRAFT_80198 [Amanita muscaria Koide BX008]|uniref:DUF221-domain-containing protein n=1 Tax=Amanita muscaria (strain Koide BX008) TaxID=946122 RepID=A0A0C2WNH1_AMAMK|nr:hypothetical protein M378DRAFT_80198 [Amanita muscaria Koide BX008]